MKKLMLAAIVISFFFSCESLLEEEFIQDNLDNNLADSLAIQDSMDVTGDNTDIAGDHVLFTNKELETWKKRAIEGPFKSSNDAFANSPGDWERMTQDAEEFMSNKEYYFYWEGPPGRVDGDFNNYQKVSYISKPAVRMMTAAFVDLVQSTNKYKPYVKKALLRQAQQPGVDFSNRSIYPTDSYKGNVDEVWAYAEWQMKFLNAYAYVGKDYFTADERQTIEQWLRDGAEWHQKLVDDMSLDQLFVQRGVPLENYKYNTDHWTYKNLSSGLTHRNGHKIYSISKWYNNRRIGQAKFIAHAGVLLDIEAMKITGSNVFKEWLAFYWNENGYPSELHRSTPTRPQGGLGYLGDTMMRIAEIVRILHLDGYENLYKYSTNIYISEGDGNLIEGGMNKSLEWAIIQIRENFIEKNSPKIYPYGSSGNSTDILMHYSLSTNWQTLGHRVRLAESASIANIYYKNHKIVPIYWPSSGDLTGFPSKVTTNGSYGSWNSVGGTLPGFMFMYAGVDAGTSF